MDFIERLFHISPDNGSGLTELALLTAVLAVPLLFAILRKRSKRPESAGLEPGAPGIRR
jgi:hypothetical protein